MISSKKVCVVGAGVSGLVAVKECIQGGLMPTCYDMDSHIGGLWHQKPDPAKSNTPMVWDHLITNTPKNCTSFSDFPFPPEQTPYIAREAMLKYLEDYAEHFHLSDYISLNTEVVKVSRADNFSLTGQWVVYTRPAISPKTQDDTKIDLAACKKEIFDAIFICSGFFRRPKYKAIQGMDSFQGISLHSYNYKNPDLMEGKTVLIVGSSLSAVDVAEDVATRAKKVILAIGEGTWILPRIAQHGVPMIEKFSRDDVYAHNSSERFNKILMENAMMRLDHEINKIRPAKQPCSAPLAVGESIQIQIFSGKVKLYGYVKSVNGSQVVFENDSVVDDVEAIIFCTGFTTHLNFLEDDIIHENGRLDLYNMMYPLKREHNTLACIGIYSTDLAHHPNVELQARYAVRITTGELKLPPQSVMKKNADMLNDMQIQRKGNYSYYLPGLYLSELIATDLGVQPSFWKIFFRDPFLAYRVWYGPCYSFHYRLIGPGSNWKEARENSHHAYEEKGICSGGRNRLEKQPCHELGVDAVVKWAFWGISTAILARKLLEAVK